MKKIITALVFVLAACFAIAQDKQPPGMRMEITEVSENDNNYSVFTYKDDVGSLGYYLSIGHEYDYIGTELRHIDEICLFLGITTDDTYDSLGFLADFFDNEAGTTVKFTCRMSTGAEKLSDYTSVSCMVVRHGLQGKRLNFKYQIDNHSIETELTQSSLKSLRRGFRAYQKTHRNKK